MNFCRLFSFFCIILFCNSAFAETDSACTRTAGGAIIANALSPGSDDAAIVTDIGGETGSSCKEIPDFYKIHFYKFGLCTANPYVTGTGSTQDFSTCSWLLDDAASVEHIISYPATGTLPTTGVIKTGTYNHLVMVLKNRLSQQLTETFNTNITGKTGTGTTCWTIASTSAFGGSNTITGETLINPEPGSDSRATLGIDCGSTADPAYTTEIYEDLGEGSFDADIEEDAGLRVALLQSDGVTKGTTINNTKQIMVVMDATYTVTEDSKYSLGFKMSASSSFDLNYQHSETKIYALKVGADRFQVTFTIN
jgi:hypothetical protein